MIIISRTGKEADIRRILMKHTLRTALCAGIMMIVIGSGWTASDPMPKVRERMSGSNIVICLMDAATTHHMSCYGYNRKTTPNIDAFAKKSVFFKNAFSQACYTMSSSGSLNTGLYAEHHEIYQVGPGLPDSFTTMAEIMKANGFATAMFCTNGFANAEYGFAQGYDYCPSLKGNDRSGKTPYLMGGEMILQQSVNDWLEKNRNNRIFAYIHLIPPHSNYEPADKFLKKWAIPYEGAPKTDADTLIAMQNGHKPHTQKDVEYIRDKYDENMLYADYNVGLLIDKLKSLELWDNTLFIVIADHGEAFMEHGDFLHNTTLYDEMIHIPMIFKFPKEVRTHNKVVNGIVESIDIIPTLADLCGIQLTHPIDGKSLTSLVFTDQKSIKDYTFSRSAHGITPKLSVRSRQYKYIYNMMKDSRELYDLGKDPGEKTNIADTKPLVARSMHDLLKDRIAYYRLKIEEKTKQKRQP